MLKTYEYRLYPTREQEILLAKHFGCVRLVYNKALGLKKQLYEESKTIISCYDLMKELTKWKQTEEFSFLYEVSNPALQQAIRHLDTAYSNYFKTIKNNKGKVKYKKKSLKRKEREPEYIFTEKDIEGFPRFKSKRDSKQSYSVINHCYVDFNKRQVRIPKFQKGIKARIDRTFEGTIKTCTVKKTSTGKYFISVLVKDDKLSPSKEEIIPETTIGIDLGVKNLAIMSNGRVIENMNFLKNSEERLKVLSRRASKKTKGSNRQKKAYMQTASLYEKISNRRKDYIHKFTSRLINDNQVNTICLEDLNVKGMLQNRKLSKAISDVTWHELVRQLNYKAEWSGKNILFIDRFYPSSKTCNSCGYIKEDLTLKDREWVCPVCGAKHDRDFNASLNIRDEALRNYFSGRGASVGLVELPSEEGAKKRESSILKSFSNLEEDLI